MINSLVKRLKIASKYLEKAATWNGSNLAVDATKDDYVFELLCYFRTALHARKSFAIEVTGKLENSSRGYIAAKWPQKPGHKKNFAYLSLKDETGGHEVYQLCPGVNIKDMHNKNRAPDITLLNANSGDYPSHTDVVACWDAKHTGRPKAPLPDTAVSDFIYTFQQLGSPSPKYPWTAISGGGMFDRSGLITNGRESSEPDAALVHHGISETYDFPRSPKTRP